MGASMIGVGLLLRNLLFAGHCRAKVTTFLRNSRQYLVFHPVYTIIFRLILPKFASEFKDN